MRFLRAYRRHNVRISWIKGHSSNPENEKCDKLAVEASKKTKLIEDEGYSAGDEGDLLFKD